MKLNPTSVADCSSALAQASGRGERIERIELSALQKILDHTPEDMTVTVESGVILATLQKELAKRGQWLPIDPPSPEKLTIGDVLAENLSGPRRFGFGTIRDHLIGLKAVLADGRVITSGGKVVKNVAGYDLQKLFIGARGSLGVTVEATFKLRPLPEAEKFVQAKCDSLDAAEKLIEIILDSELTPVVFDLENLSPANRPSSLILGFAGTRDEVDWQLGKARELGFNEPASLEYDKTFWVEKDSPKKLSVLPSKIIETMRSLNGAPFVARAGNGVIYYRGSAAMQKEQLPVELMQRLKSEFDPKNILPGLPL